MTAAGHSRAHPEGSSARGLCGAPSFAPALSKGHCIVRRPSLPRQICHFWQPACLLCHTHTGDTVFLAHVISDPRTFTTAVGSSTAATQWAPVRDEQRFARVRTGAGWPQGALRGLKGAWRPVVLSGQCRRRGRGWRAACRCAAPSVTSDRGGCTPPAARLLHESL